MKLPDLTHLAQSGVMISVRATPKAAGNRLSVSAEGTIRAYVTAAPENGKATKAVQRLLAEALHVAPSRLTLIRGAAHRDKLFRLD